MSDNVSAYTMLPIFPLYSIKLNRQYGQTPSRGISRIYRVMRPETKWNVVRTQCGRVPQRGEERRSN